uniref:DUF4806 domain-containing protein n=1 Tax=Schizaphis graminum TaxID=13262 RepID=A0A2S2NKI0_SCHGA
MESTLYSVVYFNDDNTVECVPKNWIKNDTCAWPSKHINARKMIEQNCTPNKNEFNFYKIRELCSNIKTLAEAQFKARKAQFTSDLSDNDYSKKKKLKRKIPNSTECPIYSDSDSNDDIFIIPDDEKKNVYIKESKVPKSVTLQSQKIQRKMCYDKMDPVDQSMSENQLHLMNSQSEIMNNSSVQLKYHESSTPPIKKKGNLFERGSGWSPSPLKKPWSSPKKSQALTVDISHPNLNKDPQVIIDTSDKVQRNLFGKSRSSPSPLKIQWSSPKRKKVNISNNIMVTNENFVKSSTNKNKSLNSPNEDCITNDVEFKKQILRNIMYLKVELKHIVTNQSEMLEKLQTIEKELQQERPHQLHSKNVEFNNFMADYHLPIDNEDDLNTLDEKTLNDQEFKNNLIKELSCTGGKNVKSAIKRIMSKLFSNSFLSQYSFSGKKGKKKFCNLFLLPIILKSIKKQLKFINISDHDIEEPIKTYLAQAPFAEKRKKND